MKKYSFYLTKRENLEFCVRVLWEQQRLRPVPWLVMLLVCILECAWSLRVGLVIIVFWFLLFAIVIGRNYSLLKKTLCETERSMWVENGMLKLEAELYGETPCAGIQAVRVTSHLLMLGYYQAKKQPAWYPMPLRVFADRQEMEAFVASVQNPGGQQEAASAPDSRPEARDFAFGGQPEEAGAAGQRTALESGLTGEECGQEYLHLRFWMDEEKWVRVLADVTELVRAGTLPRPQGKRTVFFGISVVLLVCFVAAAWLFPDMGRALLTAGFMVAMICLLLYKNMKTDPEKKIRQQLRKGLVQNDVCGEWQIVLGQDGVRQERPGEGKVILPERELFCLAEMQGAFYFFQKDKRHFIPVPGECLESCGREAMLRQWCMERRIPVLQGKRMRYVPGWIFYALLALLVVGYLAANAALAAWNVRREDWARPEAGEGAVQGWTEEFDPSDYPDYVPLDRQAEVLSSLGFTVPPETVAAARESVEAGMGIWVEGYPYTWLLTELGAPSYDENWEIDGYSDQVFWFDFEGWDIATDYIEVLEGMRALAVGSVLDGVENIRESTEGADWEAGTGTVEVLLDWQGKTYTWQMEMHYDWIDGEVLGIFNSLLKQAGEEKRFYVTGDNGQGALVFYGTKAWAAEFEEATGLAMETYTGRNASGGPAIVMTAWRR